MHSSMVPAAPLAEPNRSDTTAPPRAASCTALLWDAALPLLQTAAPGVPLDHSDSVRPSKAMGLPSPDAFFAYHADDVPLRFLLNHRDAAVPSDSHKKKQRRRSPTNAAPALVPGEVSDRPTSRTTTGAAAESTAPTQRSQPQWGRNSQVSSKRIHEPSSRTDAKTTTSLQRHALRMQPRAGVPTPQRCVNAIPMQASLADDRHLVDDSAIRPWTPIEGCRDDEGGVHGITSVAPSPSSNFAAHTLRVGAVDQDDRKRAAYATSLCVVLLHAERRDMLLRRYWTMWRQWKKTKIDVPCAHESPPSSLLLVAREDIVRSFSPSPEVEHVAIAADLDASSRLEQKPNRSCHTSASGRSVAEATSQCLAACAGRFLLLRFWLKWYLWARRAGSPRRCATYRSRRRCCRGQSDVDVADLPQLHADGRRCPIDARDLADLSVVRCCSGVDPQSPSCRSLASPFSDQAFRADQASSPVGLAAPHSCSSGSLAAVWTCANAEGGVHVAPAEGHHDPIHIECFHINL